MTQKSSVLTNEQAVAVRSYLEDYGRMFASLIKIRDKAGKVVPLQLNAAQRDFRSRLTGRDIILKARQLGFSTVVEASFFLDAVLNPNLRVVTFVQNEEAIPKFMRIYKFMHENLPEVINVEGVEIRLKKEDSSLTQNSSTLEMFNGSTIEVMTSGGERLGRGMTIHRALLTEVAFWDSATASTIWAAVEGALPPRGSQMVVETTANGQQGMFFKEWSRAVEEDSNFTAHFYPWWWEEGYRYEEDEKEIAERFRTAAPTLEEMGLMDKHGLSIEQMRFRRVKSASLGRDFYQEFAEDQNTAFLAAGLSIFEPEQIQLVQRFACPPPEVVGRLSVWEQPEAGVKYLITVDSSQGITDAADFDVAAVFCLKPPYLLHVATWQGRVANHDLAKTVRDLGVHYNNALVCPEVVDGSGQVVLHILYNQLKYSKIYMREDGEYGWKTTRWNKPWMLDTFKELLSHDLFRTYDKRIATQMSTYVEKKTPKGDVAVGASSGAYDDLLMAVLMATAILQEVGRATTKVTHYGRRTWRR